MRSTWRLLTAAAAVALAAPWRRVWAVDGDVTGSTTGPVASGLRYGFSECVDNERTLFYYTDKEETCTNGSVVSKPPVHGLRCDIVCDKGYFLGANFTGEVPVSGCEKCPRGKYSLGGGKLFSKRSKAWTDPLPIDIHSECVTRNLYTNEWQNNCNKWHASEDGAMIESGNNRNILEQFEAGRLFSSLRISATFVRNGTVTFQYKVSAEAPYDGLVFGIDDQTVMELVSKTEGWKEAVYKVGPGAHTFAWDYTKDFSGDDGDDKAYIKVIELVGTSYSDTYCHACGSDTTMSGGSLCAFCKENEYAAPKSDSELDFTCYSCPKNTFSPKGSIGLESCVTRRPCSSDDVTETFTRCINGKRNVTFSWSEPQTCELDLPGAASLPATKIDVACEACERGYRLNEENVCEKCPVGERIEGDGTCRKCPAGKVVVNQLAFGRGTTTGWSEWPSIIDVSAAKQAGWKLTRDGLGFSPDSIHSGVLAESTRFPLPFNVKFAHSGELEIMYALQNVPTFESDGARAWLEIEVEDASASAKDKTIESGEDGSKSDTVDTKDGTQVDVDGDGVAEQVIHLAHGGNNGTSSEGFHFNVTKPSSKQFRLVLRTTNPKAARMIQAKILLLRFYGTEEGAGVTCGTCAPGFQAIHSADFNGCKICPAGTYATEVSGIIVCEKCPKNTWSREGATQCEACGKNTLSSEGAKSCSPPTVLAVNASVENASMPSSIRYNIELIQSLVWGNLSTFGWDDAFEDELDEILDEAGDGGPSWTTGMVESGPVSPAHAFQVDQTTSLLSGLFRPVSTKWKEAVQGHIAEELVDTDKDRPYVVLLSVLNAKDAGGNFKQKSGRYGEVQCSVPAQWRVSSGGSEMAIEPSVNGSGVTVHYTGGSPCKNGRLASTTLRYLCDLKAGTPDRPTKMKHDADKCHFDLEWKTSFACPICDSSFFSEAKTSCSDGQQSVTYARNQACYGGFQPESVPVSTCSDIVLDTQTLYTAYAAISVVAFVILLLLAGIMVIHRKYRAAYNDYLYLKGKMPVNEVISKDGTKESTFEFTPTSTAIHSSSPHSGGGGMFSPVEEEEKKEDEDNARINSV